MVKEIDEFNKRYSFHDVLTRSGGIPNLNYQPMIRGNGYVYPDYGFMDANGVYQTLIVNNDNGKITIHSPFGATLNDTTPFETYVHIGCRNDPYLAANWKNDPRVGIMYPTPSIDINQITDNAPELKELALPQCIVKPKSFISNFSRNLSNVTHIPQSTCLMSVMLGFSASSGTRYDCAYEDGETVSISMYGLLSQPSGTNKTRLQNLVIAPYKHKIRTFCSKLEASIKVLVEREEELSLEPENKAKLIKLRRQINRLSKKLKFASNLNPVTNATSEALEEVLKQTGGILTAISSEQALVNSMLFSSGKKANTDLLLTAREGGPIRSNRVGRVGYSGYCSAAIFCFAQENVIPAVIDASDVTGLFERFIVMSEPDRVGERNHLNVVPPDKELLEIYEHKFDFFDKVLDEGFHPDRLITLHIAHSDWLNIHHLENEFEVQLKSGGKYAHPIMRRFISKIRMHVMSLACNLFLLEEEAPDRSCYVHSEYVLSAIYMMKQLIEGLHAYCVSQGIISNDEQIRAIFDLFVKHKDGLSMLEIKKKSEGLRAFKYLPSARKTIQDIVHYLANNNVLIYSNSNSYIKNPLIV